MRRRVIIPIQAASEFVILFTSLYSMQEKNTWIDIQNNVVHKIKVDEYVGLVYVDSANNNLI